MLKIRQSYIALTILNGIAVPITAYLAYLHYKPSASTLCNLSELLNCDVVNKSIYSEIFGVPVSILGLLTYFILLIFSIRGLHKDQVKLVPYLLGFISFATLFTLYLTGVEAFILKTFCIFCVAQQIIILMELAVWIHLYRLTSSRT